MLNVGLVRTHDPEIESHMINKLSQSGAPRLAVFNLGFFIFMSLLLLLIWFRSKFILAL